MRTDSQADGHGDFNREYTGNESVTSNFYRCTVHSDVCRFHSPTNALLLI